MDELKQCPFCGGEAKLHMWDYVMSHRILTEEFYVRCETCKAEITGFKSKIELLDNGTMQVIRDGAKEAAEAWNRRSDQETDYE